MSVDFRKYCVYSWHFIEIAGLGKIKSVQPARGIPAGRHAHRFGVAFFVLPAIWQHCKISGAVDSKLKEYPEHPTGYGKFRKIILYWVL